MFATNEDTRLVVSQEAYLLIYILELLLNKDKEIMLTPAEKVNEKKEEQNGNTI